MSASPTPAAISDDVLARLGHTLVVQGVSPERVSLKWIRSRLSWDSKVDHGALSDAEALAAATRGFEIAAAAEEATRSTRAARSNGHELAEGALPAGMAVRQLPRVWIDQAEMPPHELWLLKNLLGARDLGLIYGPPSCGKTFFTIDLVGGIAAGLGWRDRRTQRTLGIYIAAEAGRSILRRFIAWRDRNLSDTREQPVPLVIVPRSVNLQHAGEVDELIAQLREIAAEASLPIGVVVFDTLSRCMPGGDENAAADMTRVVAAVDKLREELQTAVLLIHHSGKDTAKGARGHSALVAAADTVVAVADRVATFEKVRDGVANLSFVFDLDVVEIGKDEDGEPITTCVAIAADDRAFTSGPRLAGLGTNQEKALVILQRLLTAARRNVEARGDDPASASILTSGWRSECEKKGINKARWAEVRAALEERGLVRFEGPHAMPVEVTP